MEQIQPILDIHERRTYWLIHNRWMPQGHVVWKGRGMHGEAGRFYVRIQPVLAYGHERDCRCRRNRLVTDRRWTRSGPRPVTPKFTNEIRRPQRTATEVYVMQCVWPRLPRDVREQILLQCRAKMDRRLAQRSRSTPGLGEK